MSSIWEVTLSESTTRSESGEGSLSNSPIYGIMDSSSSNNFDSNLGSDNSDSSVTNGSALFNESPLDELDLADNNWQTESNVEAEIANIRLFCESVDNNLSLIGLGPIRSNMSTPRIESPAQNSIVSANNQSVEVIDLCNLEYISNPSRLARARARPPDAIVDLCTPEANRRQPVLADSTDNTRQSQRRSNSSSIVEVDQDSGGHQNSSNAESFDPNDSRSSTYRCPVCLENVLQREPCSTKCGHVFCKKCIEKASQTLRKCPLCNKKVDKRSIFRIYF